MTLSRIAGRPCFQFESFRNHLEIIQDPYKNHTEIIQEKAKLCEVWVTQTFASPTLISLAERVPWPVVQSNEIENF